jgi:hypothetical protein
MRYGFATILFGGAIMPRSLIKPAAAAVLAALLVPGAAPAQDAEQDIAAARGWPQIDRASDGPCTAQVRGNGKIFRISGHGFAPQAAVAMHLENGDIVPLDYRDTADGGGAWSRYYMPFLWHSDGEIVQVVVASGPCTMRLSFPWSRDDPNRSL